MFSVSPVGFMRLDDQIVLFFDTPRGWQLFRAVAGAGQEERGLLALLLSHLTPEDNIVEDGKLSANLLILPLASVSLPQDLPNLKLFAAGDISKHTANGFDMEGVPTYGGGK